MPERWLAQGLSCFTCGKPIADEERCWTIVRPAVSTHEVVVRSHVRYYCMRCGKPDDVR